MLTDLRCRSAKGRDRPYKLADAKGLYLYVTKAGYRSWRWKYRFQGKEKRLTFGAYPDVKLTEARELRDEAARVLRRGEDPALAKRQGEAGATLEEIARRWHENQKPLWTPKHARLVLESLENDVFPTLGDRPISAIKPGEVRELLESIQTRGAVETAHRVRGRLSAVFGFAIAADLAESDPAAAVGKALKPMKKGRFPALTKIEQARAFITASEAIAAHPLTKLASRLLALTAARPGMIRFAEPREFEALDTAEPFWRIPAEKMKLLLEEKEQEAYEFVIPLAPAAIHVVRAALSIVRSGPYLFPGVRHAHRPMSENALSALYKRLPEFRGRHVPHGWRSTFSTIMNERAMRLERAGDRAIIDLMLAHKPHGVESRYNRAAYMPRRRELAGEWADLLLGGLPPAESLLEGPRR